MARGPLEQAFAEPGLLKEAIAAGVAERSRTRYEPPGWTDDKRRLSFSSAHEADPVRGERFAPFGPRVLGAVLDLLAIGVIWFFGFAGTAALAVSVYTMVPEGSDLVLAPLFQGFVATLPFWTLWMFNAQGWSPAGKFTHLRSVDHFGSPPGARLGLIRTLAMIPSLLPFGLGFWWAAWDREGQTWHDRIARTRVIQLLR